MKLFIIIPAYNEENSIVEVIEKIPKNIEGVDEIKILVINDGSTDDTIKKVKLETNASIISHCQNKGVGAAFHSGIDYALEEKANIVVNIDADGQFDPSDISKLINPILKNQADFVTASRFIDNNFIPKMSKTKFWGNKKVACLISWLVKKKFYDVSCGFRAYNKEALLNLNLFGQFTYVQEVFLDLSFKGLRIKEIPIKVKYFSGRKSRIFKGVFHYAFNTLKII
ncbi:glycosyltransferase family 2 protein, partial [Patescibacteria group bacterium]|nr:glycosyltransferase family 2 protein [Patescibacteria group bacterium]